MHVERARAADMGVPSPIQDTIGETHEAYNHAILESLQRMAAGQRVEVMIATHNQQSLEHTVRSAARLGLGPKSPIYFGQLLGMADHLTYTLGQAGWQPFKYVPYGKVKEVMPYLLRRAEENADMLGGARNELSMLKKEVFSRLVPGRS
eukprot:GDKH01025278.1.p1 GENE.GDKH01025278.1~~GDKH01025278.1.p1  ORF type:complete len:149 (-),score=23.44 GDKH01025278.1:145-591(-)